jgi:hypothetical protein
MARSRRTAGAIVRAAAKTFAYCGSTLRCSSVLPAASQWRRAAELFERVASRPDEA